MTSNKSNRQAYDEACRRVLVNKKILAWILQGCAEEFKDFSIDDISEKYIEGQPEVSTVPVNDVVDISGLPNEDKSEQEGSVVYDIRFKAQAPTMSGLVSLIINVEAQNNFSEGYPLVKRGIYYCSRLISSQHGPVFVKSHYEKIQKVYSIWICPHPESSWRNTVTTYSMQEHHILGDATEQKTNYDLLTVVIIGLGKKRKKDIETMPMLDMLRTIFVNRLSNKKCRDTLNVAYGIQLSDLERKELDNMCNLSEGLLAEGRAEGKTEDVIEMLKDNLPIDKIAKYSKLPVEQIKEIGKKHALL